MVRLTGRPAAATSSRAVRNAAYSASAAPSSGTSEGVPASPAAPLSSAPAAASSSASVSCRGAGTGSWARRHQTPSRTGGSGASPAGGTSCPVGRSSSRASSADRPGDPCVRPTAVTASGPNRSTHGPGAPSTTTCTGPPSSAGSPLSSAGVAAARLPSDSTATVPGPVVDSAWTSGCVTSSAVASSAARTDREPAASTVTPCSASASDSSTSRASSRADSRPGVPTTRSRHPCGSRSLAARSTGMTVNDLPGRPARETPED